MKCHQSANVTRTQISPLGLTFVFLYLPNRNGTTRPPGLVHMNPNGLPGHGLSDYRLVFSSLFSGGEEIRLQENESWLQPIKSLLALLDTDISSNWRTIKVCRLSYFMVVVVLWWLVVILFFVMLVVVAMVVVFQKQTFRLA